jgi:hypothetical protein
VQLASVLGVEGGTGGGGERRGVRRTNINRDAVDVEFKLRLSLKDYI